MPRPQPRALLPEVDGLLTATETVEAFQPATLRREPVEEQPPAEVHLGTTERDHLPVPHRPAGAHLGTTERDTLPVHPRPTLGPVEEHVADTRVPPRQGGRALVRNV